ncbi:Stigma-specific protein, Stig1 [Musa troglodytarum]|uniref:Stigma-specific protein, Stig1 n=1 Tax=Musa troglodytarum TaxID=320322 RepID=A0A9E7G137_9LILI|nr:Stigma-specific protein, Stig1 [Musa troglodytarum]
MALTTSLALPIPSAESDERRGIYSLHRQHNPRGSMTCDNAGPTAAGNKLRAVRKKCWFGQACCGGSCNCGGCNKRCKKGCVYQFGMCSYA